MKGRNLLRALLFATAFVMCVTGNAATSDPTLVFLRPAESSFWRTATNASFTVNIDYPEGATAAELTVKGMHYAVTVPNVTARQCDLTLPKATSPETEDVFDLILAFDNGVTNVASVGVIQGSGVAEPVTTRVLSSVPRKWNRAKGSSVLPADCLSCVADNGEQVQKRGDEFTVRLDLAEPCEDVNAVFLCDRAGGSGFRPFNVNGTNALALRRTDGTGRHWEATVKIEHADNDTRGHAVFIRATVLGGKMDLPIFTKCPFSFVS